MKTGLANMAAGILIAAVGLVVTALSYSLVSGSGGTYVVATGAFVVGAWRFVLGIYQVLAGALSGSSARQAVATPGNVPPRTSSSTSTTPPMPRPEAPFISTSEPADGSVALRVLGGLFLAQAALRVFFVALFVSRVGSASLDNLLVLLFSIVLPAAFAIGGAAAGFLLINRSPAAVSFGKALCIVGLLYQTFVVYRLNAIASFHVPPVTWGSIGLHFAIYVGGLIALSRSA